MDPLSVKSFSASSLKNGSASVKLDEKFRMPMSFPCFASSKASLNFR